MQNTGIVLASTTFYQPEKGVHDALRFELAQQTVREAGRLGLPIIIVDGSPDPQVAETLRALGATVYKQTEPGMGGSRRQAFRLALASGAKVILWLEPEKGPLVELVRPACQLITNGGYDIVVPRRRTLDSLPLNQALSEALANWEMGALPGLEGLDLMFGPRVLSRRAAELFLAYHPEDREKDKWHILFLPLLQAYRVAMKITGIAVDYVHPPAQTAAETGDADMDAKRGTQREGLVAGMREEARRLGLIT